MLLKCVEKPNFEQIETRKFNPQTLEIKLSNSEDIMLAPEILHFRSQDRVCISPAP